jgi:hypothetical protein
MIWIWTPWGWILVIVLIFLMRGAQPGAPLPAGAPPQAPPLPPDGQGEQIDQAHVASAAKAFAPFITKDAALHTDVFEVVDVPNSGAFGQKHPSWGARHAELNGFSFSHDGGRGATPEDCVATRKLLVVKGLFTRLVGGRAAGGITALGKPAHQVLTGSVDTPYAGSPSTPLGHALACGQPLRVRPPPGDPLLTVLPGEDQTLNLAAHVALMDDKRGPGTWHPRVVAGASVTPAQVPDGMPSSSAAPAPTYISLPPEVGRDAVKEQVGGGAAELVTQAWL